MMASRRSQGCRSGKATKKASRGRCSVWEEDLVQHTYKDVLFLLPSCTEETVPVVKRVRRAAKAYGWGSLMPPEIIHRVFQLLVGSEGAVPTLCRLAQVCRLWNKVASSPDLWWRVSLSRCWTVPSRRSSPSVKKKISSTIGAVIQDRLSQVSDFSLHHWEIHVPLVLQLLASCCPLLTSLTLSHCSKVGVDELVSVGECCPHLSTLNLQNCEVARKAVYRFLEVRGAGLRCLYLSLDSQTCNILSLLVSGSCPELRLLEVNQPIVIQERRLLIPPERLQTSCPKLEVLRLLNLAFTLKWPSCAEGPGFIHLQELCLATTTYSNITDDCCKRLLRDCTQLRVLDLRGCYSLTPQGISELPCPDVEHLYLGIYCSTNSSHSSDGCSFIMRRWGHSLTELDLTAQHFSESDLRQALGILSRSGSNDTLQSLNLTGTRVTVAAVREVLASCRALTHLDLTSCRNIPRGLKCVYHGLDTIHQCLKTFSTKLLEESGE